MPDSLLGSLAFFRQTLQGGFSFRFQLGSLLGGGFGSGTLFRQLLGERLDLGSLRILGLLRRCCRRRAFFNHTLDGRYDRRRTCCHFFRLRGAWRYTFRGIGTDRRLIRVFTQVLSGYFLTSHHHLFHVRVRHLLLTGRQQPANDDLVLLNFVTDIGIKPLPNNQIQHRPNGYVGKNDRVHRQVFQCLVDPDRHPQLARQ